MVFRKGREETGGTQKRHVRQNHAGFETAHRPDAAGCATLEALEERLYSRNEQIAIKTLEMALHYRFGKPMTVVAGPGEHPPIKIDISAIPKFRMPA